VQQFLMVLLARKMCQVAGAFMRRRKNKRSEKVQHGLANTDGN